MKLFPKTKVWLNRRRLLRRQPAEIFTEYARINKWGDKDSRSGKGSNLSSTLLLRERLQKLLRELNISTFADIPCGDFFWMQHVDLSGIDYIGGDIVPDLININIKRHARNGVSFQVIDLISGPVPKVDLIFVRDCLVHLSNDHIAKALTNISSSGSTWLLSTIYPETGKNIDIATGEWRALDLRKPPFSLPEPVKLIAEGQEHLRGQNQDKMLGLWRIQEIPKF